MSVQDKQQEKVNLMDKINNIEHEIKRMKNNINSGNFDEDKARELKKTLEFFDAELNNNNGK